jgi:hypothetical protein
MLQGQLIKGLIKRRKHIKNKVKMDRERALSRS